MIRAAHDKSLLYSLSEKQAVEWIALYRKLYLTQGYVLRFFNMYGEMSGKGAVYLFIKTAISLSNGNGLRRRNAR